MSNTFTFDTKLNNYSSIGLSLSGGIDSALLLYYLLKSDFKVKCYTLVDKNNYNNTDAAKSIKAYIEESLGGVNTVKHNGIISHEFIEYEKDYPKGKREKMNEIYIDLIKSKAIDCVVSGTTQHFLDDWYDQADAAKSKDMLWSHVNVPIYRPFINFDKNWIKKNCDINDLVPEIANISVSCTSSNPPCQICLYCREKYAAFGFY